MLRIVITIVEWKLLEKIRIMLKSQRKSATSIARLDWQGLSYFSLQGYWFCVHFFPQRSVPKSFDQSMTNLQNKVRENNCASKFERCVVEDSLPPLARFRRKGWELVYNPGHTPLLVVSSEMFVCWACFENMQKSSRVLMLSLSVLDFGEEESNKGSKERAQGTQSSG